MKFRSYLKIAFIFAIPIALLILLLQVVDFRILFILVSIFITTVFLLQAIFTLIWMTYAWDSSDEFNRDEIQMTTIGKSRRKYHTFSIIVPGLHEEDVIYTTVSNIAKMNYPVKMFEVFVVHREDDKGTIAETKRAIADLKKQGIKNVQLLIPDFRPRNKPDKLNFALQKAKKDYVVIFDAEDEVHPELLNAANDHFKKYDTDILQAGVQLMNYRSRWFSALNCLEYYYWFRSALQMFSKQGVTPLGGVSVFFRKKLLVELGGWDADCLTEDCDVGFRLSLRGAKIRVLYDPEIATRESTPLTVEAFVKQRTRWDLGFLQVIQKADWLRLASFKHKLLAATILFTPIGQTASFISIPILIAFGLILKIPIVVTLYSMVPGFVLVMLMFTQVIILYDFTASYKLKYPIWLPVQTLIAFIPYVLMLSFAATRALFKYLTGDFIWEKTPHNNTHRRGSIAGASLPGRMNISTKS